MSFNLFSNLCFELRLEIYLFFTPLEQRNFSYISSKSFLFCKAVVSKGWNYYPSNSSSTFYTCLHSKLSKEAYSSLCSLLQIPFKAAKCTHKIKLDPTFPFYPGYCRLKSGAHMFNKSGTIYKNFNFNSLKETFINLQVHYSSGSRFTISDQDNICYYTTDNQSLLCKLDLNHKSQISRKFITDVNCNNRSFKMCGMKVDVENKFLLFEDEDSDSLYLQDLISGKFSVVAKNSTNSEWNTHQTFLAYDKTYPITKLRLFDIRTGPMSSQILQKYYTKEFTIIDEGRKEYIYPELDVNGSYLCIREDIENNNDEEMDEDYLSEVVVSFFDIRSPLRPFFSNIMSFGFNPTFLPPFLVYQDLFRDTRNLRLRVMDIFSGNILQDLFLDAPSKYERWNCFTQVDNQWQIMSHFDSHLCFFKA